MKAMGVFDRVDIVGSSETLLMPVNIRLNRVESYRLDDEGYVRIHMMSGDFWCVEKTPDLMQKLDNAINEPVIGGHVSVIGKQ